MANMTDFATIAREILGYPVTSAEREEWAEVALKGQDGVVAALVAAHEAAKREALDTQAGSGASDTPKTPLGDNAAGGRK